MTYEANCPECDASLSLRDPLQGEIVPCPECGVNLEVVSLESHSPLSWRPKSRRIGKNDRQRPCGHGGLPHPRRGKAAAGCSRSRGSRRAQLLDDGELVFAIEQSPAGPLMPTWSLSAP